MIINKGTPSGLGWGGGGLGEMNVELNLISKTPQLMMILYAFLFVGFGTRKEEKKEKKKTAGSCPDVYIIKGR